MKCLPKIYAIIPVFNGIKYTIGCLECIYKQTYKNLKIIVVDGGSSDGTPEIIKQKFPDVIILNPLKELWWGQAMQYGIDVTIQDGITNDDYILMINNDTVFDGSYVKHLYEASEKYNAAIGGVIRDVSNPDIISDAGARLDMRNYKYDFRTQVDDAIEFYETNVLPGRNSLFPYYMIRAVGGIDVKYFPHYVADYDLTYRIHRLGFRQGVIKYANVYSYSEVTGYSNANTVNNSFKKRLFLFLNKKSLERFIDHYNFLKKHLPPEIKKYKIRSYILGRFLNLFLEIDSYNYKYKYKYKYNLLSFINNPGFILEKDFKKFGHLKDSMLESNIICATRFEGAYKFVERFPTTEFHKLYKYVNLFWRKAFRSFYVRYHRES